jgi:4-hydroxy-tetrahydrodipicolinate synthase
MSTLEGTPHGGRQASGLGTILTAIVTPFDEQGRVDEESFVALMHNLAEHGSDGFAVCGTTGEAATLTD